MGQIIVLDQTLTRPSNTTQYAAGDVISAVTSNDHFTFSPAAKMQGGAGVIRSATFIGSSAEATKPDVELWLFDTDIAEVADNSAFAPTDAEMLRLIAVIAFPVASMKVGGANIAQEIRDLYIPFRTIAGSAGALFGQLVARNAYTPVSAEVFKVRLAVEQE